MFYNRVPGCGPNLVLGPNPSIFLCCDSALHKSTCECKDLCKGVKHTLCQKHNAGVAFISMCMLCKKYFTCVPAQLYLCMDMYA